MLPEYMLKLVANWVRMKIDLMSNSPQAPAICHLAAPKVTELLQEQGIDAVTCKGWVLPPKGHSCCYLDHLWTEADGFIVDTTIDQLGPEWPKVLIVPIKEAEQLEAGRYTKDVSVLRQHLGIVLSPERKDQMTELTPQIEALTQALNARDDLSLSELEALMALGRASKTLRQKPYKGKPKLKGSGSIIRPLPDLLTNLKK